MSDKQGEPITFEQAYAHFNNYSDMADAFQVDKTALRWWRKKGKLPKSRQAQLENMFPGEFRVARSSEIFFVPGKHGETVLIIPRPADLEPEARGAFDYLINMAASQARGEHHAD